MPDIFDQIHSEQPQATTGGDVFDQIHAEAQAPVATDPSVQGHAPTMMDGLKDSASFLGNELGGVASALNPVSIIHGLYQTAVHPYDAGQNIAASMKDSLAKAYKDTDPWAKAAHIAGAIPMSPVGQMYDQYQNGDMSGLAKSFGNIAGNIILGKASANPSEAAPLIKSLAKSTAKAPVAVVKAPFQLAGKVGDAVENQLANTKMYAPADAAESAKLVTQSLRGSVPAGRTSFYDNLNNRAMPLLKEAEQHLGKPIEGVDDLLGSNDKPGAIQIAKELNRDKFNQLMDSQKQIGAKIDLSPVADAIEGSISPKVKLENPGIVKQITDTASKYRKAFDVQDVDSFLRTTNNELESYYSKNPAARRSAVASNPDTAMLDSQAQAFRKALYDHLDAPGQGTAARELQRDYGSLSELEEAMMKRKNVALRQAPNNLSEQLSKWDAAKNVASGGFKMLTSPISENPFRKFTSGLGDIGSALAETKVANWIKDWQSTDGLIGRAFKNYSKPSTPIEMPPEFQPKGLLEAGATRMPSGPDQSGPVPFEPTRNPGFWEPFTNPKRPLGLPSPTVKMPGVADGSGAVPYQPNPGLAANMGQPGSKRLLGPASQIPPSDALGSRFADVKSHDMVLVKNPQTGKVEFMPSWMLHKP